MGNGLYCVGNAIVDIYVDYDDGDDDRAAALCGQLGITESVQHVPQQTIDAFLAACAGEPFFTAGGGAANVARAAARLGLPSAFAGAVGSDGTGRLFAAALRQCGAAPLLVTAEAPTGRCLVIRFGGETRIAASPSAALCFDAEHVDGNRVRLCDAVVLDGYVLGRAALTDRVLELAKKHGTIVALDIGAAFQARQFAKDIAAWCAGVPMILFMNEREAEEAGRVLAPDAAPRCVSGGGKFPIIVHKLAERGAAVFSGGETVRVPAEAVPAAGIVDSTGAGDAFAAGFLTAFFGASGKTLAECAAAGNRAASLSLNVKGCG